MTKPRKTDEGWRLYIEKKGIHFDQAIYWVDAAELAELSDCEPRILAKFDTSEQLARPLAKAGYTLLPVRNGQYVLLRGNLFVETPPCGTQASFEPRLAFPLLTAGRGSGESQYIDQAFNSGLLADFLGLKNMFLTIRGREYTGRFRFRFSEMEIEVESVQIEVDAGYESLHDIVLVEAKIGIPKQFNVRQMYYPFRHFSQIVPQKHIRNVFLAYDIPSSSYHFHEYRFTDEHDPLSILQERCNVYRITPAKRLHIHELLDARFQTRNDLVPQADDLNKVFELLTLVEARISGSDEVADYFAFAPRQSNYYAEAAEYLGLVHRSGPTGPELTDLGIQVLSEPPEGQSRVLAKAVVNSWIVAGLVELALQKGAFTVSDIDALIQRVRGQAGQPHYTGQTVSRRRQTIKAWLRWLADEMGCFSIEGPVYRLL